MSLVSGLFTFPVSTAFQAYKQVYFEFPLEQRGLLGFGKSL